MLIITPVDLMVTTRLRYSIAGKSPVTTRITASFQLWGTPTLMVIYRLLTLELEIIPSLDLRT